ncbi:curli synthesis inhibitor [Enterobacter wuhouensis]|uniref:curli synthesis inhibitor n=1 Tax=Enterobacter wuhouensis TaxID=2529381 RepID=UPI003D77320A
MKAGLASAVIALVMPICVFATTLRLSTDIDLLVLDGKKVSSSLLRGADSIELDNGPHQVVFRIEKPIRLANHEQRMYISPPLILSFNTQRISKVNFNLPRLETDKEAVAFDAAPRIELLDGDSMPIPVKLDILAITQSPKGTNYEADTENYNKANKHASLPQFATMMADDSTLLSGVSELDVIPPQSQTLTEQRLKFWFQQADPDTRARFLQWVKQQPSS